MVSLKNKTTGESSDDTCGGQIINQITSGGCH